MKNEVQQSLLYGEAAVYRRLGELVHVVDQALDTHNSSRDLTCSPAASMLPTSRCIQYCRSRRSILISTSYVTNF